MTEFSYQKEEKSVGEAVYDSLRREQPEMQVGDVIESYADDYVKELQEVVEKNLSTFESPFYVLVLHKKEPWAMSVLRNWFVARQTAPSTKTMWQDYQHFMHTLYKVDKKAEKVLLVRSLPSPYEAKVILDNFALYDPQLVKWCREAFEECESA